MVNSYIREFQPEITPTKFHNLKQRKHFKLTRKFIIPSLLCEPQNHDLFVYISNPRRETPSHSNERVVAGEPIYTPATLQN
jgi:hypothetical protein